MELVYETEMVINITDLMYDNGPDDMGIILGSRLRQNRNMQMLLEGQTLTTYINGIEYCIWIVNSIEPIYTNGHIEINIVIMMELLSYEGDR